MYVSSLLLSKANKDRFLFNRLGVVFQRKWGTDITAWSSRINHIERQNSGPDMCFLPKEETAHRRRCSFGSNPFIYLDCKNAASLSKPNNQQFPRLAPLSQLCNSCKAFSWRKIKWLLSLLGFVLLSAFTSVEILLLLPHRQAHNVH